jgi:hypothetical protein
MLSYFTFCDPDAPRAGDSAMCQKPHSHTVTLPNLQAKSQPYGDFSFLSIVQIVISEEWEFHLAIM